MRMMARLVSEDNEVVMEVPTGETVLGRGPLLGIVDKRVSRNHASLEWKNGNLTLCPKHHNPCFLRGAGETKYSPLVRDKWVELHHGDYISLLPDSLIYRVELRLKNEGIRPSNGGVGEEISGVCQETECVDEERSPAALREGTSTASILQHERGEGKREQGRGEVAVSTGRKRALPAWLSDVRVEPKTGTSKVVNKPSSRKPPAVDRKCPTSEPVTAGTSRQATSDVGNVHPASPTPDEKRPAAEGSHPALYHTTPPLVEAVLSDPQAESPTPSGESTSSKHLPCPYGAECYRKNPAHFKEYSHDRVDEEDKPECPYGAECYRKNPTHRRNFKHPGPPADPPALKQGRRTRTRKKPRVSALAGDSDDSEGPNAYDYTDSFIDDAEASSESTSYGGSEDSDWAPPAGEGERGGEGEGESLEDVGDLVEEARSFLTNKKMWQS